MIQQLKLRPQYANQNVIFTAYGNTYSLNIYWLGYILNKDEYSDYNTYFKPQFYADLYQNNIAIITCTPVIVEVPINIYPSLFNGYVVPLNIVDNTEISIDNLGIKTFIYFVDNLSELDTISRIIA